MADKKTFHLPDLGEGLPDATIVEWLVKEGGTVTLDAPLVSMETAKAVVEVPSPFSGKLAKIYGKDGDVIATGAALADFEIDPKIKERVEEIIIFTSPEEPPHRQKNVALYKELLDARVISIPSKGHFVYSDMKTNEFPELLEEILK